MGVNSLLEEPREDIELISIDRRNHFGEGYFMRSGNYESSDKSSVGTAVTFLLVGLGAGALVALLLAPKAGKEMRREIRRRYSDVKGAVEDFAEEAKERVDEVLERGSEWAEEIREKVEPLNKALRKR
jgi:gas vesicle protein